MISKGLRDQLEKIECTLKCGSHFQYISENSKGDIKMKCPGCDKNGLSNIITVQVKKKCSEKTMTKKSKK